jgi:hypothetical protein
MARRCVSFERRVLITRSLRSYPPCATNTISQADFRTASARSFSSASRDVDFGTIKCTVLGPSCLLALYLGFSWLPSILPGAGLGAAVGSSGITAFNLGGVFGATAGGYFITPSARSQPC